MGQQIASECQCNDGFFHLCAPEAPANERQNEISGSPHKQYPYSAQGFPAPQDLYQTTAVPEYIINSEQPVATMAEMVSGSTAVIEEDYTSGLEPPSPATTPAPKMDREPWCQRITFEDILSNLEDSEEMVYGEAFSVLLGGHDGYVGLDSPIMRSFICNNSFIDADSIDLELLKVASDEGLSRDAFLALLREFCISEAGSISQFLNLSANGEDMNSEECRTGLLLFGQESLASSFSHQKWESILNTVMSDAGIIVRMDEWIVYCRCMGRIVRLESYVKAQQNSSCNSRGTKIGVVGGA